MKMTLADLQAHCAELFGRRILFANGSYDARSNHFYDRIGKLADAHRKGQPLEKKLAPLLTYFMSLVNYFGDSLDLTIGMVLKFPSYGCSYCHEKPCVCSPEHRPEPIEREPDQEQFTWSLSDWQTHLFSVYGARNVERGFAKCFMRLVGEHTELNRLMLQGPGTPMTSSVRLQKCEREAADILSWIIAMAYILDIDLEKEVMTRYQTCPVCRNKPCTCPFVIISPGGDYFGTVGGRPEEKRS